MDAALDQLRAEGFGSALSVLGALVDRVVAGGVPRERIGLLGFSQGACLALEFARRKASRFGVVIGFSGGLIGEMVAAPALGDDRFESTNPCQRRAVHAGREATVEAVAQPRT